jgi:hypothetical protein
VIETGAGNPCVRANLRHPISQFEKTFIFEFKNEDWVLDPGNDLAVCPLPHDFNMDAIEFGTIMRAWILTREQFNAQDIGPGDDVFYVGRFMGHAGKWENNPSVRFGNISMNPNEREPVEWETATRHYSQVGFLVEARSRSGYSGSPVFFLEQHVMNRRRAVVPMFDVRLLGVDWGHLPEKIGLTQHGHTNVWEAHVHSGMMGVVPSWVLLDFLDNAPRLIEQRRTDDEHYAKTGAKGVPDVSSEAGDEPTQNEKPGFKSRAWLCKVNPS